MSKPVKVTFTPPDPKSWLFDPNPAKVKKHESLELTRYPSGSPWIFISANDLPGGYTGTPSKDGSSLTITNAGDPPFNQNLPYTVTIETTSIPRVRYTSPIKTTASTGSGEKPEKPMLAAGPPPMIANDGT